tara:strand:+ start:4878 stop:6677 length:1800 start_codon:yes stop_codon:yes gene_type:complete
VIIIEGKKEDVVSKLKQRFEYDGPFIDRVLNVDPTGYKYVEYIAKKLEKIIPELGGPHGGLNVRQGETLQELFGAIIPWFHENVDKITEDDILNTEEAIRNDTDSGRSVPNIDGIITSPKDINQYENPQFIKRLMNFVDGRKSQREMAKEAKSQSDKIYEDDDVLVVSPKSHSASCYYGANTKWCTTQKDSSRYFDKYSKSGTLYYFLNKKTGNKVALYRNQDESDNEVFDSKDVRQDLDYLRENFPNQIDLIDDLSGTGQFLKKIRQFTRGKISEYELEESDPLILQVKASDPLGQSTVVFDLKDDDGFLKLLDLDDSDIWFFNVINSYYDDYEFMDSYSIDEEWKEGYLYFNLTDENKEKLKDISEILLPSVTFDLQSENFRSKLSSILSETFEDEVDYILSDYSSEKNREMNITARESIDKEIDDFLESTGFSIKRKYDEIMTTPANILWWSVKLGINKTDAISLLRRIVEQFGTIGGWAENSYEYQDENNFDNVSFNNEVERQLDNILEKMEDDENPISEFLEFRKRVLSKFKQETWYELPKDKKIRFKIKTFDRDGVKVVLELQTPLGYKRNSFNKQQFHDLLYQPELFKFGEV